MDIQLHNIFLGPLIKPVKKEDEVLLYFKPPPSEPEKVYTEQYGEAEFTVLTNGSYPTLKISMKNFIGMFSGFNKVNVPDASGETKTLYRSLVVDWTLKNPDKAEFTYSYNEKTDKVLGHHTGKVHLIKDIKKDAKAFIDAIRKSSNSMIGHLE